LIRKKDILSKRRIDSSAHNRSRKLGGPSAWWLPGPDEAGLKTS